MNGCLKYFWILVCFCSISQASVASVQFPSDSIHIKIHLKNGPDLPINISTPIHGAFFIGNWTKGKTNKSGTMEVTIPLDSAGFCQIWLNYLPWIGRSNCIQLYVEPGETYRIDLVKDAEFDALQFEGDNVSENSLLNSFDRYRVDYWGQSTYLKSLLDGHEGMSILDQLSQLQKQDLDSVHRFLQGQETTNETFIKLIKEDIRYYYAQLFYVAWEVQRNATVSTLDSTQMASWDEDLQTLLLNTPINNVLALGSYWYNDYRSVIWPRYFDGTLAQLTESTAENRNNATYDLISQNFSGIVKEHHLAYSIRSNALKNKFSEPIQQHYLRYKKDFPSSPFLSVLNDEFEGVLKLKTSANEPIYRIQESDISDFDVLFQLYPDQLLYIDLWASWCGPCKQEFKALTSDLYQFIEANNIQLIYISIDEASELQSCQDIISYYRLKGDHYLANETFVLSIQQALNKGQSLPIPHYLIVNQEGEIVFKNAARPSQEKSLMKQLKKAME